MTLTAPIRSDNDMNAEIPRGKAFCCYILASDRWPTPYTGKTCDLAQRLHRHNNPSPRSRAYTKEKGRGASRPPSLACAPTDRASG